MGRRPYLRPAPGAADLLGRAVHEIVRDFPEALEVLRSHGVDPAASGGRRLGDLPDGEDLARALVRSTAWRPER